jgi:hypothetical protein
MLVGFEVEGWFRIFGESELITETTQPLEGSASGLGIFTSVELRGLISESFLRCSLGSESWLGILAGIEFEE